MGPDHIYVHSIDACQGGPIMHACFVFPIQLTERKRAKGLSTTTRRPDQLMAQACHARIPGWRRMSALQINSQLNLGFRLGFCLVKKLATVATSCSSSVSERPDLDRYRNPNLSVIHLYSQYSDCISILACSSIACRNWTLVVGSTVLQCCQ